MPWIVRHARSLVMPGAHIRISCARSKSRPPQDSQVERFAATEGVQNQLPYAGTKTSAARQVAASARPGPLVIPLLAGLRVVARTVVHQGACHFGRQSRGLHLAKVLSWEMRYPACPSRGWVRTSQPQKPSNAVTQAADCSIDPCCAGCASRFGWP